MIKSSYLLRLLFLLMLPVLSFSNALAQTAAKAPEAETKAAAALEAAVGAPAKLAAASDFVKKYPTSSLLPNVADHLVAQISTVTDATAKAKFADDVLALFQSTTQSGMVSRAVLDAYLTANKLDEAFALGEKALATNPEDIFILAQLTRASSEAVKKQNGKFVATGIQYGTKVIELIEAQKKPLWMSETTWNMHVKMLPLLYQDVGIFYLVTKELAKAKTAFERAITLAPSDPMNLAMMASVLDEEYLLAVKNYQGASAAQKDALLKKANEQLDLVIVAYAKAIAVASVKPEYQPMANQARQNLEPYYKYRNNNSTEGMDKLIEKYKPATTQP